MKKHEISDLYQMQGMSLNQKIEMTKRRIEQFYEYYGGAVYVSFSGGKDSTVLKHIVDSMYSDVESVFIDTGLEYPEVRKFAMSKNNVTIIKPKLTFKQVIEKYGYPIISKEQAQFIQEYRETNSNKLRDIRKNGNKYGRGRISNKYFFLTEAPFKISGKCCNVMKKNPAKQYEKKSGKKAMVATMASESKLRTTQWMINGCNSFDGKRPMSKPMSFWTEQDVLLYIKLNNIEIAGVYGDIVSDVEITDSCADAGIFDDNSPVLRTTGCDRTGCMFCMFGCQYEDSPGRFERMKETHPKQYDYIMRPCECGGLDYENIINWMNDNGNIEIKY